MKTTNIFALLIIVISSILFSCDTTEVVDPDVSINNPTNNSSLQITFNTNSSGQYAPAQILAVWVCDANNTYVKSLLVRGNKYKRYLSEWDSYSGGDDTDAITGASLFNDDEQTAYWNFEDFNGYTYQPGSYKIYLEGSSDNGAGPNRICEIDLGNSDTTFTFADDSWFKNIEINYTAPE